MSSRKCLNCGLVSFATAENCKRCSASLKEASAQSLSETAHKEYEFDDDKPRRKGLSPLRILLLILLVVLPCWYYYSSSQKAIDKGEQTEKKQLDQNLQKLSNIDAARDGYRVHN